MNSFKDEVMGILESNLNTKYEMAEGVTCTYSNPDYDIEDIAKAITKAHDKSKKELQDFAGKQAEIIDDYRREEKDLNEVITDRTNDVKNQYQEILDLKAHSGYQESLIKQYEKEIEAKDKEIARLKEERNWMAEELNKGQPTTK